MPLKVVFLFGPTAVGKTVLIERIFSEKFEIISADSVQVYHGLDIGSAKPAAALRARITHHLIDVVNPDEEFSAGDFVREADRLVGEISARGHIPVISGGTGFYIRNFLYGLPRAPRTDKGLRSVLQARCREEGLEPLFRELCALDAAYATRISPHDKLRVLRALEVYQLSGKPLSFFKPAGTYRQEYDFLLLGLNRERRELHLRIEQRVDAMFAQGLSGEVRELIRRGYTLNHPGMRAIGYREFLELGPGCSSMATLRAAVKAHTRAYAKRQITFLKALPGVSWYHPDQLEDILTAVKGFVAA